VDLPEVPVAAVRAAHLAPGLGPVDLWIDGTVRPSLRGVDGPGGSRYRPADPGRRLFRASPPGDDATVLAEAPAELEDDGRYALVVGGDADGATLAVWEESTAGLAPGTVRFTAWSATAAQAALDGGPEVSLAAGARG
jgi:hypothetical protein